MHSLRMNYQDILCLSRIILTLSVIMPKKVVQLVFWHMIANLTFRKILGGNYISTGNDIEFTTRNIHDRRKKLHLPIHFASSIAKSLLLLDIYVNHLATENDILIIDEPELNLHPDNQRLVARFLAWIVKRGIKVLITTHSDYIIKEFNILGCIAKLHGAERENLINEFNYSEDEILDFEQIKAYSINQNGNVKEAKIGQFGIDVESFNTEINAMNGIYDKILEKLDETNE